MNTADTDKDILLEMLQRAGIRHKAVGTYGAFPYAEPDGTFQFETSHKGYFDVTFIFRPDGSLLSIESWE